MEKVLINNNEGSADFSFLRSSDPFHAFYQHTLAVYRSQNQPGFPEIPKITTDEELHTLRLTIQLTGITHKDPPPESPKFSNELDNLRLTAQFIAITRNESDTINVTAQLRNPSPFRLCKTITRNESDTIKLTPQLRDPPPSRLCQVIMRRELETIKLTAQFVGAKEIEA